MSTWQRGGKWVTKFTLDGEQHWVGTFESEREGKEAEEKYRRDLALAKIEAPSETCESWGARWLEEFPRPGEETRRQYERAVQVFIDHFQDRPVREVSKLEARAWALKQSRGVYRVVVTMMNEALSYGIVDSNPFAGLRIHEVDRNEKIDPPTLEQYQAYLDACTALKGYGPTMRRMIQFAAWTGVRQGELFALRWQDVDPDNELVHVRQSRKRGGTIGKPKNGRERTILYPPPAQVLHEEDPRAGSEFVFHSPEGKPLLRGTFGWSWEKVRAAARIDGVRVDEIRAELGQEPIRWHDWRHFFASQAMDRGVSVVDIAQQLGHLDNGILVAKRYGHPDQKLARERLKMAFGSAATCYQSPDEDRYRSATDGQGVSGVRKAGGE